MSRGFGRPWYRAHVVAHTYTCIHIHMHLHTHAHIRSPYGNAYNASIYAAYIWHIYAISRTASVTSPGDKLSNHRDSANQRSLFLPLPSRLPLSVYSSLFLCASCSIFILLLLNFALVAMFTASPSFPLRQIAFLRHGYFCRAYHFGEGLHNVSLSGSSK